MTYNPLLETFKAPNYAPEFDRIKPEHYIPALEQAIADAKDNIENIKNNPEPATFQNTLVALETADETLGQILAVFYHLLGAIGGDELHSLAEKIGPLTSNFSTDICSSGLKASITKKTSLI